MRGAYSEIYLDDAMRNMGEMVEYGEGLSAVDMPTGGKRGIRVSSAVCPEPNCAAVCLKQPMRTGGRSRRLLSAMTRGKHTGGDLPWPITSGGAAGPFRRFLHL